MRRWHFQHARTLTYMGTALASAGIVVTSLSGSPGMGAFLVSARQLFGLWALGLLLGSMFLGPLTFVLPWIPLRSTLLYGRRALGISAFVLAMAHVACYLTAVLLRNWRELYTPGIRWVAGLFLGALALADLTILAVTSRDAAVRQIGGRRWKRLHQSVYITLGVVLVHALLTGADFGLSRGPDVRGEPDAGAGITFLSLAVVWLMLFVLRRKRISWRPNFSTASSAAE